MQIRLGAAGGGAPHRTPGALLAFWMLVHIAGIERGGPSPGANSTRKIEFLCLCTWVSLSFRVHTYALECASRWRWRQLDQVRELVAGASLTR